jgi:hypothetical protein
MIAKYNGTSLALPGMAALVKPVETTSMQGQQGKQDESR